MPLQLFGREAELKQLLEGFQAAQQGHKHLFMVGGPSGVGKSALMDAACQAMEMEGARILNGKFEQRRQVAAYAAWRHALEGLGLWLTAQDPESHAQWKQGLAEAIGENGRVVTSMSPSLESFLGPQPSLPPLDGENTRVRHLFTLRQLFSLLAHSGQPLVLVLDDWQWADEDSVLLLDSLVQDAQLKHLMILCAYRDNELKEKHPFHRLKTSLLTQIFPGGASPVQELTVLPLSPTQIIPWLESVLNPEVPFIHSLASRLHARTYGNPLHLQQLLVQLLENDILYTDDEAQVWQFNVQAFDGLDLEQGIGELLAERMKKLPEPCMDLLQLGACVGSQFSVPLLKNISGLANEQFQETMAPAEESGLIISIGPMAGGGYRFVHDAVQQQCYNSIPLQQREHLHMKVAEEWARLLTDESSPQDLFDLANAYNAARNLSGSAELRHRAARLNLRSARAAHDAAAFKAALDFAHEGMAYLSAADWHNAYSLILKLHLMALESAYNLGNAEEAEHLHHSLLEHTQAVADRVKVLELRVEHHKTLQEYEQAFTLGVEMLGLMGVNVRKPTLPVILQSLFATRYLFSRVGFKALPELPASEAPQEHETLERAISLLGQVAYFYNPNYFPPVLAELKCMLRNGYTAQSAYSYMGLAMLMIAGLKNIQYGYRLAQVGIAVKKRFPSPRLEGRTAFLHIQGIRHWMEPLEVLANDLDSLYSRCMGIGDFEYAGFAVESALRMHIAHGTALPAMGQTAQQWQQLVHNKLQQQSTYTMFLATHHGIASLLDYCDSLVLWNHQPFDGEALLAEFQASNNYYALSIFYWSGMQAHLVLGHLDEAQHCADAYEKHVGATTGSPEYVHFLYMKGMLVGLWADYGPTTRTRKKGLAQAIKKLKGWAKLSPHNLKHKLLLLQAEQANLGGQQGKAANFYAHAITLAQKAGALAVEATAHERMAQLKAATGQGQEQRQHLEKAMVLFQEWGCQAKATLLQHQLQAL